VRQQQQQRRRRRRRTLRREYDKINRMSSILLLILRIFITTFIYGFIDCC
jgi:hypothetical protein